LPEKSDLRGFLRLDRAVGEDVANADAALVEVEGYQQEPVAIERLSRSAHMSAMR